MKVNFFTNDFTEYKDLIKFAECVAEKENINNDINIIFVDKKTIKELNSFYRGKDYPTDVLTFVYNENELAGEVYLCPDVAKENAPQNEKSVLEEIKFLIAHGILHIKGYTHETEDKYNKMMELQERYLKECI